MTACPLAHNNVAGFVVDNDADADFRALLVGCRGHGVVFGLFLRRQEEGEGLPM